MPQACVRGPASSVLSALGLPREQSASTSACCRSPAARSRPSARRWPWRPRSSADHLRALVEPGIVTIHEDHIHVLPLAARDRPGDQPRGRRPPPLARPPARPGAPPSSSSPPAATRPGPGEVERRAAAGRRDEPSGGTRSSCSPRSSTRPTGDLLWLRPDPWRMPRESAMAKVVGDAIASGRRSRAIYPVRALHEAPDTLRARAQAGEQVRVDLRPAHPADRHRQHPRRAARAARLRRRAAAAGPAARRWSRRSTLLFELMWDRAAPVPDLDLGEARPDLRRFLLQQLAAGANDEQIARTLGISLRTVRRRVATLLIDLGVDSGSRPVSRPFGGVAVGPADRVSSRRCAPRLNRRAGGPWSTPRARRARSGCRSGP